MNRLFYQVLIKKHHHESCQPSFYFTSLGTFPNLRPSARHAQDRGCVACSQHLHAVVGRGIARALLAHGQVLLHARKPRGRTEPGELGS